MYVDDCNTILEALGLGIHWNGQMMRWTQEWEEQDRAMKEKGELDET